MADFNALDNALDVARKIPTTALAARVLLETEGIYVERVAGPAPGATATLGFPASAAPDLLMVEDGSGNLAGTLSDNIPLNAAGLAIGTGSKAKVLITNTVNYMLLGELRARTTAEAAFTATTHDIAPAAGSTRAARYLLSLNASGTVTITKGTEAATTALANTPATPANNTAIGYVGIQIAAGATPFDASTDELDAAHITDTYVDFNAIAGRPKAIPEPGTDFTATLSNADGVLALTEALGVDYRGKTLVVFYKRAQAEGTTSVSTAT